MDKAALSGSNETLDDVRAPNVAAERAARRASGRQAPSVQGPTASALGAWIYRCVRCKHIHPPYAADASVPREGRPSAARRAGSERR